MDPELRFGDPESIALRNAARPYRGRHPLTSRWRREAAPIVLRVLLSTLGMERAVIRRELRKAYPFGAKSHHPYKIWLDEIRRQVRQIYGAEWKKSGNG